MEKTNETILKMKQIKKDHGLSLKEITRMTETGGRALSFNTVQKLFRRGSENGTFRQESIDAVAAVLLPLAEQTEIELAEMQIKNNKAAHNYEICIRLTAAPAVVYKAISPMIER